MSSRLNKPLSRRKFLASATAAALGSILAACAPTALPTTQPQENPQNAADPTATSAPKATDTKAPEATATSVPVASELPYEILYHICAFTMPDAAEVEAVTAEMNKVLKEKINATIKLNFLDGGTYNDKMRLINASREAYDLAYTASWTNFYYANVQNGVFVPLDDLLPEYAPTLWNSMPKSTWEAARFRGKIYATINQQIFAPPYGFLVREDLAKKYNLDPQTIETWDQLTPFLEAVKQGEGITPIHMQNDPTLQVALDDVGNWFTTVRCDDPSATVLPTWEQPEQVAMMDLRKKWIEAGYYPLDRVNEDEATANFKAGKHAVIIGTVVKPGVEVEASLRYGVPMLAKAMTPAVLTTGKITSTLTGISSTSKNPIKALQFIELLHADPAFYNLLCLGVEGRHWEWVDKDRKLVKVNSEAGYNINLDWEFGNQFNAYYKDEKQIGAWDEMKRINDTAIPSPALGFAYDGEPMKNEIAVINQVGAEFLFERGGEQLAEINKHFKEAGIDKVIADTQAQIEAWKKTKA